MKDLESKYIFNPYYTLINDNLRIILLNSSAFRIPIEIAEDGIFAFIHPVHAVAFSLFNGENSLEFCLSKISELFDATLEESYNFISPFFDNEKRVGIEYGGYWFEFPRNILLNNSSKNYTARNISYQDYFIDEKLDFQTVRLFKSPTSINLLVNTVCLTDCIYCYVQRDKRMHCKIPIEKLCELISNAKKLNVVDFDISGTEVFLYEHWDILLENLLKNGYYPYLSTKIPLTKKDLHKIKDIGINDLQISIDTARNEESKIVNNIKVDNYILQIFETLRNTEEIGLKISINTVLTKYNYSFEGIELLLNQINCNNNIEKVTFNPAASSFYCSEDHFNTFKLTLKEIKDIEIFIDKIKSAYPFEIILAGYEDINEYKKSFVEKEKIFNKRAICTANISQFCILPDGQVTICEELYWQPNFIIGNILTNTIDEIWQSKKALDLYKITKKEISHHSPCKTCDTFDTCRRKEGVCWSDVLNAYGAENWDFPSSNCPFAPFPYHKIYHE